MEKQRSFYLKSTRFLVFSFTITSSVIFLTLFSIWVVKFTPSLHHQEAHLHFNKPSLVLGQNPNATSRNSSVIGVKDEILIDTHFGKPPNLFGFGRISVLNETMLKYNLSGLKENDGIEGGAGVNKTSGFETLQHNVSEVEVGVTKKEEIVDNVSEIEVGITKKREIMDNVSEIGVGVAKKEKIVDNVSEVKVGVAKREEIVEKRTKDCDLTKGRWVYDESYPLYTNSSCPFIDEGFNCMENGRLDKDYMKWKWQPLDCDIPRFNALKMLESIRGKRLVFVGDSINRNQWESMLCLLMGAIKDPKKVYETHGRKITKEKGNYSFKFVDYKCTVEFYVSHFLVHEGKTRVGQKRVQTLRIDTIHKSSSRWRGADILVFNTANWWSHFKTKAGINYYQEGVQVHPHLDVLIAYRRALQTWASWVKKQINPNKTHVFFRSSAPSHFSGGHWNSGGRCGATRPINETLKILYPEKNIIAEEVIKEMKIPITFLNVVSLSEYRIDGHPSIYGRPSGKQYSTRIQDCSHWCLPGVPDAWNELLYFHLQSIQNNRVIL